MNRIQSKNHDIGSHRINKIYFFSYNYRTYVLKDGYSRLPHFHICTL